MKRDATTREEAAHWFAVLRRGPMSLEERARFDSWRADPANQRALDAMHELWGEVSAIKALGLQPRPAKIHRPTAVAAGLAAAVVAVASLAGVLLVSAPQAQAHIRTRIGEQETKTLPDGSVVAVNVATSLAYRMESHVRAVRLSEGEAAFFVKKSQVRPFLVDAGDYRVRSVGTAFDVRLRDGLLDVSVGEGVVEISAAHGPKAGQLLARVSGGEHVQLPAVAAEAAQPDAPRKPEVKNAPAQSFAEWRLRTVRYEDASVSTVVEDLNRFYERPLEVADADLARQRVTIRLQVEDRDETLRTLAALLGAQVEAGAQADSLTRRIAVTSAG